MIHLYIAKGREERKKKKAFGNKTQAIKYGITMFILFIY